MTNPAESHMRRWKQHIDDWKAKAARTRNPVAIKCGGQVLWLKRSDFMVSDEWEFYIMEEAG